jgi:trans-aconitate methyltransferase
MPDQWNATLYDDRHRFVSNMATGLVDLLAPQNAERILDLGCGTGDLAQHIAASGAFVTGVDASPAMITAAREKYPALQFAVADVLTMNFSEPFDAIFSNAMLHWVKSWDAARAISRMFAALKPGGRLVLEMGGKGNVATILQSAIAAGEALGIDLHSVVEINYFPTIGQYATQLEAAGFDVSTAELFDRPTPLIGPAGLRTWVQMFRPDVEKQLPAHRHEAFYTDLENRCRSRLFCDAAWFADYRRLRIVAKRPKL